MLGQKWFGAVIGTALLVLLIYLELIPVLAAHFAQAAPNPAPTAKAIFGAQFAALPDWVKIWMHFQDIIMGGILFFVLWRKEAQIYGLAVLANHIFLFIAMPFIPLEKVSLGLAALSHYFWLVPLYFFIKAWPTLDKNTGYGTWVTIAIAQIIFSLSFDLYQGAIFVLQLLS